MIQSFPTTRPDAIEGRLFDKPGLGANLTRGIAVGLLISMPLWGLIVLACAKALHH